MLFSQFGRHIAVAFLSLGAEVHQRTCDLMRSETTLRAHEAVVEINAADIGARSGVIWFGATIYPSKSSASRRLSDGAI
jgi:hypothetical protein